MDDSTYNIFVIKDLLNVLNSDNDLFIETALNGQEALEKVDLITERREVYHIILMDL